MMLSKVCRGIRRSKLRSSMFSARITIADVHSTRAELALIISLLRFQAWATESFPL